ncbi:sugar phosphate isomerase/epimerase [Cytobacillus firmus]|uniref:sugar phosphate isomerase/epimerase n=1 Tax=Cytobacillus firmus TaxID=1399 RepID=UPI002161C815|nr:sugar phosphate isomerase/epimerase [Cytobacillus firmus]MCS0656056.1 sugar phosphate isomerase/epimerase [Cytobacillus firmus]
MVHKIGVSGSVILSDSKLFHKLFKRYLPHIEIGEFQDEESFQSFIELLGKTNKSFGLHSPLFRGQSKYDLLEEVSMNPEEAWIQFEAEVERMSRLGAEYILVHFPYFKKEASGNPAEVIEEGLKKLSALQKKYGIMIVCEPKLGFRQSPAGIDYLDSFPVETWKKYGLSLCVDIGDYILATDDKAINYIGKWAEFVRVVHLHNVEYQGDKYIWVPVHPSHENDGRHHKIKKLMDFLAKKCEDVFFVMEYTPHTNPSEKMAEEGVEWAIEVIEAGSVR